MVEIKKILDGIKKELTTGIPLDEGFGLHNTVWGFDPKEIEREERRQDREAARESEDSTTD